MRIKMRGFEGRLAFVTGGSSGIGLCAAEILAGEGADVVVFARGRERLEEAVRRMEAAGERTGRRSGQRLAWRKMDVSDHEEVARVMEEAVAAFGAPDILINSAGRAYPDYFPNIPYEQFDETMKVHIYGAWNTVSSLVPHMRRRGGYIVNVASVLGFLGVFGYADYCPSKFAIVGFSEVLASELKRWGIGVSVVCPPDTDTPGFAVENRTKPPETAAVSEGGGLMQPQEVAQALIKGMRRGKLYITPGGAGMLYYMKRFFPRVVDLVMDSRIRKAQAFDGITLRGQWAVEAPVDDVFRIMTDFQRFPERFPKVAESIRIDAREGNSLEMEATVRSFGKRFRVRMKTRILPGRGFVSDNDSYQFGTSGHEEMLLSERAEGTRIDYTYQVRIHRKWLRLLAVPLLRWYSMRHWERAVIGRLKEILSESAAPASPNASD